MAPGGLSNWEERYRSEVPPTEPAKLLVDFSGLLPHQGRALDVAAGAGRHSVFLAELGLEVVAVERSREGLARGRELARQRHVRVDWVEANLDNFEIPSSRFDVIACFYFRDPALYPSLCQGLCPGGLIFYETYTRDQLQFSDGPRNPAHLVEGGELLRAFQPLDLIYYRETWRNRGVASLLARRQRAPRGRQRNPSQA